MKVVIKCKTCRKTKEITTYPSRLKNGRGKYCSNECRLKGLAKVGRETLEEHRFSESGEKHPNFGKKYSLEERIARSCKLTGKSVEDFDGFTRSESKKERIIFRKNIHKQVLERDNYTCQLCGKRGCALQIDHIQPWAEYVELRFSIDNCRTLCENCHYKITFGREKPEEIKTWGQNLKQVLHLEQ